MEGFDKTDFYLMFKPCTGCVLYGFYFLKYLKVPSLNKTWISHNLFKKRRTIVLVHRFSPEEKSVSVQRKRKPSLFECVIKNFQAWHLKNFIVPYNSLSQKHCSKVILFISFE